MLFIQHSCYFCDHVFGVTKDFFKQYFKHMAKHRNVHNMIFICPLERCSKAYKTYQGLYNHCKRLHITFSKASFGENEERTKSERAAILCKLDSCQMPFFDMKMLIKHTKNHLRSVSGADVPISCPFQNCSRAYSNILSFSSHLSRTHRQLDTELLKHQSATSSHKISENCQSCFLPFSETDNSGHLLDNDNQCNINDLVTANTALHMPGNSTDVSLLSESVLKNIVEQFAMFFLKLEARHLVPQKTIQNVFDEIRILTKNADDRFKLCLIRTLNLNESEEKIFNNVFNSQSCSALLQNECCALSTAF